MFDLASILLDDALEAAFWALVDKSADGCWLWRGPVYGKGYGTFISEYAHRVAFTLSRHRPPTHLVCHHCDVRNCVHPFHLFEGTAADNSADMKAKWRQAHSERHSQTILSPEEVYEIRAVYDFYDTVPLREVAAQFGMTTAAISSIGNRLNWKYLPEQWERPAGTRRSRSSERKAARQAHHERTRKWTPMTADTVLAIRAAPGQQRDIARQFNVTQATVSLIKLRKTWKHI